LLTYILVILSNLKVHADICDVHRRKKPLTSKLWDSLLLLIYYYNKTLLLLP